MTSVGSVSIDLSLNRGQFDRDIASLSKTQPPDLQVGLKLDRASFDQDLRSLQNTQLTPVSLDVKLSPQSLQRQIRDLKNGDYGSVAIDLTPNLKGFYRQIRDLPKSVPAIDVDVNLNLGGLQQKLKAISKTDIGDCIDICLHPDIVGFRKKLEGLYKLDIDCIPINLCPDLKGLDSKVRAGLSAKKYSTDIGLNTGGFKDNIEGAFTDALKRVQGKGIFSTIGGLLIAPLKLAVGAITPIFIGLGTAIGFPLGTKLGSGLAKGIQSATAPIIGSFELLGEKAITSIAPRLGNTFTGRLAKGIIEGSPLKQLSLDIAEFLNDAIGKTNVFIERRDNQVNQKRINDKKQKNVQKAVATELKAEIEQTPQRQARIKELEDSLQKARNDVNLKREAKERAESRRNLRLARTNPFEPNFAKIVERENLKVDQTRAPLTEATTAQKKIELELAAIKARPARLTQQLKLSGASIGGVEAVESTIEAAKSKGIALIKRLDAQIKIQQTNIREARARLHTLKELNITLTGDIQNALNFGDDAGAKQLLLEKKKNNLRIQNIQSQEIPTFKQNIKEVVEDKNSTTAGFVEQRKNLRNILPTVRKDAADAVLSPKKTTLQPRSRGDIPEIYADVARQVAAISGIQKLDPSLIPKLNVSQGLPGGTFGNYDPKLNQINVSKEAYEAIKSAKLDFQAIETLVHELRHAVQFGFGKVDAGITGKAAIPLNKASSEEVAKLGRRVEKSVEAQEGENQAVARTLETDAYVFASRNAKNIAQNIERARAVKSFEANLGLGGSKADLQLQRAQIQQSSKIVELNKQAQSLGLDMQAEMNSALLAFSRVEAAIAPMLEKARGIEILPVEGILAIQKSLKQELEAGLATIAKQTEIFTTVLDQKKQIGTQEISLISSPSPLGEETGRRVNQLTKPQLNKVAKKLGIKYSDKKADALRKVLLKEPKDKLESALPGLVQEIPTNIKLHADDLSRISLDAIRERYKQVSSIIKQIEDKASSSNGNQKIENLKQLLDTIEKERVLIRETLTRELNDDVKGFLRSQQALIGKPRRKAQIEYSKLVGNASARANNASRVTSPSVEQLARRGGSGLNALPSFEDTSESLKLALSQLNNNQNKPLDQKLNLDLRVADDKPLNSKPIATSILGVDGKPLKQTRGATELEQEKRRRVAASLPPLPPREATNTLIQYDGSDNKPLNPNLRIANILAADGKPINQNIGFKPILGTNGRPLSGALPQRSKTPSIITSEATPSSNRQILGANGQSLNPLRQSFNCVNILNSSGTKIVAVDPIEKEINTLKRQELYRKAEIEEDLARLKVSMKSGLRSKRKNESTADSSNEFKQLETLLKSVDEALSGVDKEVASQIKDVITQAQKSVKTIKKLNNKTNQNAQRSIKKTDNALKQLEDKTNTEVKAIESESEAKRQGELRQLENRFQRRYGIQPSLPISPLPSTPGDSKSEIKSIGGAIKSVFKGLQTSRFDAAKKQAEALAQQANILLIDINSTIAIGKAATSEAKSLQKAITASERKVEAILNQIKKAGIGKTPKLTPGDLQRLTGQASDLNKQIDASLEALAAANLRATKGKELQPFADRLKAGADAPATQTNLNRIQDLNRELKQTFRSLGENPSTSFFSSLDEGISGLIPKLGGLVKGFLAFQGALIAQNAINAFARGAIDAAVKLDKLQTALKFASGSEVAGTRNLEFIRSEVERLKIPLGASTEGFTKLAAATKGTALAGKTTRDIFTGVSEASTVLSLTSDETSRALLALTQIVSKGKVQAEELRGQLSESGLAGAMGIAARAMGVTETQFNKLLETGQVLASDFLPRFAKQLHLEFGGAAVEASGNAQNAIFGLQNAILSLQESAGKSILPVFTVGLNALSGILKTASGSMGEIVLAVGALTIALSIKLGLALKETIANLILTRATGATLGGAFNDVARYINNSATVKIAAGIFVVIEAVKLLNDTVNTELVKSFRNAADSAQRAANASGKALTSKPQSGNDKDNLPSVNIVDTLTKGYARGDILTKVAANAYLAGAPAIGELLGRGVGFLKSGKFDYYSYAELQRDNLISGIGDFNFGNNQLITKATNQLSSLKSAGGIGGVDSQLKQVESDRAILQSLIERDFSRKGKLIPPEYQKQVTDLTAKIEKLNDQKVKLSTPVTEDLLRITNQIAATRSQIQALEDQKTIDAIGGPVEAEKQKQFLQNTLDALIKFKYNTESALASLKVDPLLAFTGAIAKLNIELAKNQEATQKAFLTQKAQTSQNAVSSFSLDKALTDTTALKNATSERDRMVEDLASFEKDMRGKQSAIAAPEFGKTLQKFDLTPNSSVAEISAKIDIAEDTDKPLLEKIKALWESETKLLEVRSQAADAEQKLQQARQTAALNSLGRYSDETLALSKRTENQQTESLKLALLYRKISEEEGAVRSASIQAQSVARQKDVVDTQLNLLRSYYAQGVVGAEEFNKRERELLNQQSDFKRSLLEAEISLRESQYKQILDLAEQANQKVEGAIALNLTNRNTAAKQLQLQLLNRQGDQKAGELQVQGLNIDADKEATEERIDLIKVQLEQVKISEEQKYITAKEATTKRRQLLQQLADANQKQIDTELAQEKNYREQVIQLIESQLVAAINSNNLTINGIERQKDAQNLLNQSIERSQKLEVSRHDLNKAIADAALTQSQIQLDKINAALEAPGANKPELLQQRANIENQISQKKLDALRVEQEFQRRNLQLELQKQAIVAKTAVYEAEIAKLKAIQGTIEANAALVKAYQNRDTLAIDAAKLGLEIANRQLELSDRQLANARENLKIQNEIASNSTEAQRIQQTSALDKEIADNNLRLQKSQKSTESSQPENTNTVRLEQPSEPTTAINEKLPNKLQKQLSLFEQSKLKVFAPDIRGINTNVIDQSGSRGLNPRTSVEAFFKRQLGLDPSESNEHYFQRSLGLNPKESHEAYFNRSLRITPTDLVKAAKPVEVKPQANGFTEFTKGLAQANKGIEAKLSRLIEVTSSSLNSPRNLYVSSPNPVSDASQIYAEISRGMVTASGLG